MEKLKYIVEDRTIAELLGVQNFTNKEAAVLELVKNAYDAGATTLNIEVHKEKIIVEDNGKGMNITDIKNKWMQVGNSDKGYSFTDDKLGERIYAGSKGVGRFALARLGSKATIITKKKSNNIVEWTTDWSENTVKVGEEVNEKIDITGTRLVIIELRDQWSKKTIKNLSIFLSYACKVLPMRIVVNGEELRWHFLDYTMGQDYVSEITLFYRSDEGILDCKITSDEFQDEAQTYTNLDIKKQELKINISKYKTEIRKTLKNDITNAEIDEILENLGNFQACFYFGLSTTFAKDTDRFLYKYGNLKKQELSVVLYRNYFSISSYEGQKDWLDLNARARKSPAAATHPTGDWRVRSNQLTGMVNIDKKENKALKELSNRQGMDEDNSFKVFLWIIQKGIEKFESYRQNIVKDINKKNKEDDFTEKESLLQQIIKEDIAIGNLNENEKKQFVQEVKKNIENLQKNREQYQEQEKQYRYDFRILSTLSTEGLKAAAIAHEHRNVMNILSATHEAIIYALEKYSLWDTLNDEEHTKFEHLNVPFLLEQSRTIDEKILEFMHIMLSNVEKQKFVEKKLNLKNHILDILSVWKDQKSWVDFTVDLDEDLEIKIAPDILQTILDNLILNSIQQNDKRPQLNVSIKVNRVGNDVLFEYRDDGKGLEEYLDDPSEILKVHSTSRDEGHGLGMWIVNTLIVSSGGMITNIEGNKQFKINFFLRCKNER